MLNNTDKAYNPVFAELYALFVFYINLLFFIQINDEETFIIFVLTVPVNVHLMSARICLSGYFFEMSDPFAVYTSAAIAIPKRLLNRICLRSTFSFNSAI